ncbi:lysozyme family protein [Desulforhopalus singaporensis]
MAFNLGVEGLFKFRRMWSAIRAKNFDLAADGMLKSCWAKHSYSRFSDLFAKDATLHEVSEVVMMNFKGARLSSTIYPEMKSFFS